jgi:hypothetical protein
MPDGEVNDGALIAYLAQAIVRASGVYSRRPVDDPQHPLALGEVVALFNLADEFGLMPRLREVVDRQAGQDVYGRLSEAMKSYYLGLPARSSAPAGGSRPPAHRPPGQRPPAPRSTGHRPPPHRPPQPGRGDRPRDADRRPPST